MDDQKILLSERKNSTTKMKSIRKVEELVSHQLAPSISKKSLEKIAENFSIAITPDMYHSMDLSNSDDPIMRQFVPSEKELHTTAAELNDPIGDESFTTVKGIIHRYPDRCLFKPVNVCPVYCRFCFRREKVGPGNEALSSAELNNAYEYIRAHPSIWEVVLTGGDPLILKPKALSAILKNLDDIETVGVVRIHTRVPVVDPERINSDMLAALSLKNKPTYIALHANHSNEFTQSARDAIATLVNAGIPMLSQSVLLRGVNDNIETLSELMRTFIKNRVKPYYLHHGDMAKGTSHFRTSIAHGQNLMQKLRGYYSGICQPLYVIEIPGGYGKVPIQHNYIRNEKGDGNYCIEDYQGKNYHYQDNCE